MNELTAVPAAWKHNITLSAIAKESSLYEESFSIEEKLPVSYWGQLYSFKTPIEVTVRIYRAEGSLYTDIKVEGTAQTACARCLEPASAEFSGELKYLFSLNAQSEDSATSDGDEDIIALDSWEDEIDISPQVWEVLLTALPAVILCKPDCKGLCQGCGANLNSEKCSCGKPSGDVRFEVLKQLMEEK